MPSVQFSLNIEASEIKKYYSGQAKNIIVTGSNGLKIQFPANLILPYVAHNGVSGNFILKYDGNGKAQSLQRINLS